jgi:sulfur-carrier protein
VTAVPVRVRVPTIFRALTEGEAVVEGEGRTIREVLQDLDARYPGLAPSVITGAPAFLAASAKPF